MGGKLSQRDGQRLAGGKPIPKSQFALPDANGGAGAYPIDTAKRARNALSRIAQFGTDEQKARVRAAVKRSRFNIKVGGVQNHSNNMNFAGSSQLQCPNCGYRSDDADFKVSGGSAGTSDPASPAALQTPQPTLPSGGGMPLTVRGAGSPNMGLANSSGRVISLARRAPVRTSSDLVVSRQPDGSAIVRHRQGGGEVGKIRPNSDGTWQSAVDGHDLLPHRHQRAALAEMVGVYNSTAVTPDRAAQPLMPVPAQTPLMQQYGVPAIRLASDNDADDTDTSGSGLNPRGQGVYKKLLAKGVTPKVAMAMAKRSQNFGQKAAS